MVAASPENNEEYREAVAMMPRSKLENFVFEAANAMEDLEQENAQLRMDIDDVKKIDVEVIDGWRQWNQTLDEEREKWANLATDLSTEKYFLNEKIKRAREIIKSLLRTIGDMEINAMEYSQEGTKVLQLRTGYKKLLKMTKDAVDRYSNIDEELEAELLDEEDQDQDELS